MGTDSTVMRSTPPRGASSVPRGASPMSRYTGPPGCSPMNMPVKRTITPAERMANARAARGKNREG